ncbi:NmrA-like family domain-containing protein 1 [Cytospora mali]|uniref:NmrA-like family domain-containing protein 1 n=1 Tax=Cytospora mali TaxID=578113 RepID=A0A194UVV2_CYTMA|nr:NmrA-like family domain-containing protein 1 [Valsa mali var. pyri (nom. inval.)]
MAKLIVVFGATGNQGGSVAKLLLQHPSQYAVRAVTRDPSSETAQALAAQGAEVVQADLTVLSSLSPALKGCWGVFGVTNFYDSKIKDDPGSEEQQGRNLVDAAMAAGTVECFVWSTLPSSRAISGGRFVSRIYEGKYHVDDYIREKGFPACFVYTGNFYENMILRSHMRYNAGTDTVEFHQPLLNADTKLAMLFVEKDLSGITKAVFDQWGSKKEQLNHRYLYCCDARVSPNDILDCVKRVTGKNALYVRLETTGWKDRDVMFQLYNECGMYGNKTIPDENVLALGVKLHGIEDFVRTRLLPHLGLTAVDG